MKSIVHGIIVAVLAHFVILVQVSHANPGIGEYSEGYRLGVKVLLQEK